MASPNSPVVMGPRHSGVQLNGRVYGKGLQARRSMLPGRGRVLEQSRLSSMLQLQAFRLFAGSFSAVLPFRALVWECHKRTVSLPRWSSSWVRLLSELREPFSLNSTSCIQRVALRVLILRREPKLSVQSRGLQEAAAEVFGCWSFSGVDRLKCLDEKRGCLFW